MSRLASSEARLATSDSSILKRPQRRPQQERVFDSTYSQTLAAFLLLFTSFSPFFQYETELLLPLLSTEWTTSESIFHHTWSVDTTGRPSVKYSKRANKTLRIDRQYRQIASSHVNYVDRNLIEKWFQTLAMRIDRFHQTWMGRRASAQRCLTAFVHYYNRQRPNQALDNRTPAEEVMNR